MLSKALVNGAYQRKLEELARLPGLDLLAVVPPYWRQEGQPIRLERTHGQGYELAVEPMALNGHFHVHCYPLLRRRFRQFRPQLVHIDEEPYNLATFQAAHLSRHFGARCLFFTWQNLDRRYPWPFAGFERYVWRNASAGIAGNADAAAIQRRRGFHGRLDVIPQIGVDPEQFAPSPRRPDAAFTVGYVGRLVASKGLWQLCEALERLPSECRLLLVGRGPLGPAILQRATENGWASRLEITSAPSDGMPQAYQRMDCLVLPSLTTPTWKEQFGRALMEAMACGVPVVGSDSGEIPSVIGGAGILTPEGDIAALARAISRLQADPGLRQQLAAEGRARVLERFTHTRIAQQTYSLYQALLADAH
ncbi:MAG TPA: glycosyltransferase [Chloroflexota bacterium]|nr:glycosyltransferase [Chloroflexota bacterium]